MRYVLIAGVLLCYSTVAHAQGWVREPDDVYQAVAPVPLYRAYLPPAVDLSDKMPPVGNQGEQGSCTAWAVGYGLRSYYEGQRQGWDLNSPEHVISPASIYDRLTTDRGRCEKGTSITDALTLLKQSGAASMSTFPYSAAICTPEPAHIASVTPDPWRITGWRRINMKRADDIKGELAQSNPVVFGMDMPHSFRDVKNSDVYADSDTAPEGGHAMVIVGYDDARQAFKVFNSWGTYWGDKGYGWVAYGTVAKLSDRGFVMDLPPAPPKPPAPVPVVAPPAPPPVQVAVNPPQPQPAPAPIVTPQPPKPEPVQVVVNPPQPQPQPAPVPIVTPQPPKPEPVQVVVNPPQPQPSPAPVVTPQPLPPKPPVPVVIPPPTPQPAPHPAPVVTPPPMPPPTPVPVLQPPVPQPPIDPVQTQRARLATALNAIQCQKVEVAPAAGPVKSLRGFVGSDADRDALAKIVPPAALAGLLVRPWPQCEALLTFAPALSKDVGLAVQVSGAQPATLAAGDSMVVEVTTPLFPSYLYATYLQASGDAVHLAQPIGLAPQRYPPGTKVKLGGGGTQPTYRVGGPFGREMIVVIASASPLFDAPRPASEIERDYLTAFRIAFLQKPKPGMPDRIVTAATAPLTTREK